MPRQMARGGGSRFASATAVSPFAHAAATSPAPTARRTDPSQTVAGWRRSHARSASHELPLTQLVRCPPHCDRGRAVVTGHVGTGGSDDGAGTVVASCFASTALNAGRSFATIVRQVVTAVLRSAQAARYAFSIGSF